MIIDVQLRSAWVKRVGYRYDVLLNGEIIDSASRDPEYDAARALKARGFHGRFRTIDFFTGRARMEHDIEKAAGLCTIERDDVGVLVVPYRPMSEDDKSRARLQRACQGSPETPRQCSDTPRHGKRAGGESAAVKRGWAPRAGESRGPLPAVSMHEDA